ncbi:MAG: glycosyltransferase [Bacteroidaceae bacterium]|nr:glycosyltransferase [Bacteroidaceae bacterium]
MKNMQNTITIMLPAYNSEKTIAACIDSILCQTFTDFELLIADDGSTDDTLKIVESYQDSRIRILRLKHDFIHTLNTLLDEAKGRYVARMDADDVMLSNRLQVEFDYLEQHPDVDVVGGNWEMFGLQNNWTKVAEKVSLLNMLETCCVCNSTVLMRQSVLQKYQIRYEQAYIYSEDYRFLVELLKMGVLIRNISQVIGKHLISEEQITYKHKKEQEKASERIRDDIVRWTKAREDEVKMDFTVLPESRNKLSVVIAFLNEREEVARTVRSVRETVGDQVEVIVINDHSDDGYDYETDLKGLGVHYYFNKFRIGAAASKEKGVQISSTPYFILLDAHMRFYDHEWVNRIVSVLDKNSQQLLCSQTKVLSKKVNGTVEGKDSGVYGAYVQFAPTDYIPNVQWNTGNIVNCLDNDQIPAVLGAGYSSSKVYWNKLKGLQGLIQYGSEEAYISIKAWLEGGGCRLLNDVVIGHIYRDKAPYQKLRLASIYNYIVIDEVLLPTSECSRAHAVAIIKGPDQYEKLSCYVNAYKEELSSLKNYYTKTFIAHDFEFIRRINDIVPLEQVVLVKEERRRLKKVVAKIFETARTSEQIGLFDGNCGKMLVAALYAELTGDQTADTFASEMLSDVLISLYNEVPVTFANGICGVGWSLIYLVRHNLLEDNLDRELTDIDRLVMERDVLRMEDRSLLTGAGGILCYVVTRFGMKQKLSDFVFDKEYLESLNQMAEKIIAEENRDFRLLNFALQYVQCMKGEWVILPPQLEDIMDFTMFLPKEEIYQKEGLRGRAGFALFLIDRLEKIKRCRPFLFNNKNKLTDEEK